MKILIEDDPKRYAKFRPDLPVFDQVEMVFCLRGTSNEDRIGLGDAEILLVDAISTVEVRSFAPCPISG